MEIRCFDCGKVITSARSAKKYCDECREKHKKEWNNKSKKNRVERMKQKVFICERCGQEYHHGIYVKTSLCQKCKATENAKKRWQKTADATEKLVSSKRKIKNNQHEISLFSAEANSKGLSYGQHEAILHEQRMKEIEKKKEQIRKALQQEEVNEKIQNI